MFRNSKIGIFLAGFIITVVFSSISVWAAVDISNIPLDAQSKAAPANIMFVLDDSGSMDWEFMTAESNGLFSGQAYIFGLQPSQMLMWKSQWFDYNKMYYDPAVIYTPWPMLATNPWQNGVLGADPDNPRSHPFVAGNTINLSRTYIQFFSVPGADIIVDNEDAGFSEISGSWAESGATPEYAGGSLYGDGSVEWSVNVAIADNYQVWAWWSSRDNWSRDTAAIYTVNHSAGATSYTVNQTIDFGQWSLLGSHDFTSGSTTIDLAHGVSNTSADAIRLIQGTGTVVNIPRAHYYVYSTIDARPYLVTIDAGTINYYAVTVSGTGSAESVSDLQLDPSPPADVQSPLSYTEARQNFANWYSFYRKRQFTATAAVANVISQMAGVQIGISTIWDRISQPVMKVKVDGVDQTDALLTTLYGTYSSSGGTPLRLALTYVGKYFDDAVENVTDTGYIGTCPYSAAVDGGECQQAFAILMTDGFWNGGSPGVNNVDDNFVDGDGVSHVHEVPFADVYPDTLADVAMQYWKSDLSSGLANLLSPTPVDPATWQHMVTYGVSFGVIGTLDPATHDPATTPWPQPNNDPRKIDDLYHASVNGHGTFLSAANPTELVNSLLDIMLDIKNRIGSASSVSVNGDELYKRIDNNTYMFQSSYDTVGWLGDIKSYKVDPLTGAIDLAHPDWSADIVWQTENWSTYWNLRPIATYTGSTGVPFRIGSLTASQEALLDPTPATAQLVLNYVRGDGSNEQLNGGTFRNRTSRLGDVVHSSPVYHEGLLYVGANDGMMHAIIAEGTDKGKEFFSYVPSQVIQNLSLLADPTYSHDYYVDLTVSIEDNVTIGATDKTILVGGLGNGGKGYYVLDITGLTTYNNATNLWQASPVTEAAVASKVLWEFPNTSTASTDKDDIGYSFSKPLIVRTNDSTHPWVVIFGNGYNSTNGQSVLFILDPADGTVLRKFELGSGPDNGLATPSVTDVGGNGKADYVYAGDLDGNLWKIDLTDSDINNWEVAFAHGGVQAPLFKATGPTGLAQPITSKPDVMYHPLYQGYLVAFATGKFLGTSDFLDTSVQTVYGIWDYGDDTDDTENLGTFDHATEQVSEQSSRSTLLEQELLVPDFTYDPDPLVAGDEETLRVLTDNTIYWVTEADSTAGESPDLSTSVDNNAGWYFDLPNSGERVTSRMMIRDGRAIFISFTPKDSPCTPGGNSILHEVDAKDGSRLNKPVFDVNGNSVVDSSDMITVKDAAGNVVTDAAGNALLVAATGIQRAGHLQTPAILRLGKEEIKYMSSTSGSVETVTEAAVKTGVSSWKKF